MTKYFLVVIAFLLATSSCLQRALTELQQDLTTIDNSRASRIEEVVREEINSR